MIHLNVIKAIFKRNFYGYFANPTGYVFIFAFVLCTGLAAFWPPAFFNNNLANLDQLNEYMPLILLGFIPAITMTLWADERRQGTDELLLTLPASDLDVVTGKYLGAVSIFTVSLIFAFSNIIVLGLLGDPDRGLMFSTYFGYWLMGITMLSIGMSASFLSSNITVAFVLAILLNAPLALAYHADNVFDGALMQFMKRWSLSGKASDLSRGVVSFSSLVYFLSLIVTFSYLNMILIGERHWHVVKSTVSMEWQQFLRVAAALVLSFGLSSFCQSIDIFRFDVSSEKLSSLTPQTESLLKTLQKSDSRDSIHIEAYVSPEDLMPESYIQARINLLTMLDEVKKRSRGMVTINIHEVREGDEEIDIAEERYGIEAQRLELMEQGRQENYDVFMGVAIKRGLDKLVIPFFDRGIPAEYELVRSIVSLTDKKKKTIGIVSTGAQINGGFSGMQQSPKYAFVTELEKQFEVKEVNPASAISADEYDAILAVQPSSLSPAQMPNFIKAVKDGIPTVIYEDPTPFFARNLPGTAEPNRPQGNPMMGRQQPPQPKGNIQELWDLLEVDFSARTVIRQHYNPYPTVDNFPPEFVFVNPTAPGADKAAALSLDSEITSGLQQVLLLAPGEIKQRKDSKLNYQSLIETGNLTETINSSGIFTPASPFGGGGGMDPMRTAKPSGERFTMAARITGSQVETSTGAPATENKPAGKPLNVVLIADMDLLGDPFFNIRQQGPNSGFGPNFDFDNVTFALNTIDMASGEDRFIDIRKRRRVHRTLTTIEKTISESEDMVREETKKFMKEFQDAIDKENESIQAKVKEIQDKAAEENLDQNRLQIMMDTYLNQLNRQLSVKQKRMERKRDKKIRQVEDRSKREIRNKERSVKFAAVTIPPIVPLLIAIFVFIRRKQRELEGAVKSRLR